MAAKALPSRDILNQLLRYEPETGKLFWRERTPDMFPTGKYRRERVCAVWNSNYAGKEAFTAIDTHGYPYGNIFNRKFKAHRVIWCLVHGHWPVNDIDHIDGDCRNNRLENLRCVTHGENLKNQRRPSDNTSGVVGVCWHKQRSKWKAEIQSAGVKMHLGVFENFKDAVKARRDAEVCFGFHPNHGNTRTPRHQTTTISKSSEAREALSIKPIETF